MSKGRIFPDEGISFTVCGIPCLIYLTSYSYAPPWKGSAQTCPSSDDYYGYEDMSWELYNLRGYRMIFLEKKCSDKDLDKIYNFVSDYKAQQRMNKNNDC